MRSKRATSVWGIGRVALVAGVALFSCKTAEITPTPSKPINACHISCPDGFFISRQLKCRSDKRWFEDVLLIGRSTTRNVDGTVGTDVWIARYGREGTQDFPVVEVKIGTCSSVIRAIRDARPAEERGHHPGDDY